jgi:hypothetical protein
MMTMFVLGLLSSAFLVCCSLAMAAGVLLLSERAPTASRV